MAEHNGLFDGIFARGGAGTDGRAWLRAMLDTEAAPRENTPSNSPASSATGEP